MLSLANQKGIQGAGDQHPKEWADWARQLQRLRLSALVAALLESGGAFATLAAQSLYVSQPLLEAWLPARRMRTLAGMLEDPDESSAFARMLREEAP